MNIGQNEIWRAIDGYLNYEVSSHGRVRNNKTGFIYKNTKFGDYYRIALKNDNGRKLYNIHKLVAETFIDNENNYPVVDHIDQNKLNNYYENLRWTTYSGNGINCTKKPNKCGHQRISEVKDGFMYRWTIDKKTRRKWFKTLENAIEFKERMAG